MSTFRFRRFAILVGDGETGVGGGPCCPGCGLQKRHIKARRILRGRGKKDKSMQICKRIPPERTSTVSRTCLSRTRLDQRQLF